MKSLRFLLLFKLVFMLQACGPEIMETEIDPELAPLLEIYLSKAPNKGHLGSVESITFGDPGAENDGITTRRDALHMGLIKTATVRKVIIRRKAFQTAMGKRAYIHELGHAIHGLDHTSCKDDIMSGVPEYQDREEFWKENLYPKIEEMF